MAPDTDEIPIDESEAAKIAGVACFTLGKYRREGRGPKHMRIGRLVRYLRADVLTWRDAQQEG